MSNGRDTLGDPFAELSHDDRLETERGASVLMLTPVNRPADAIAMLGLIQTEYHSDATLTAVARSWEERFGAVVTAMGVGSVDLTVGAPPDDSGEAKKLAAEQLLLAPDGDLDRRELAYELRKGQSRDVWQLGWPD
jgi:hypothetical protein